MCGRYATTMDPETLYGTFEAEPSPDLIAQYGGDAPRPRYNIAPTSTVPVVRVRRGPGGAGEPGGASAGHQVAAGSADRQGGREAADRQGRRESADQQGGREAADRQGRRESADLETVREVELMRWGLVPSWAKDIAIGSRMFNARAESLTSKPAFRRALAARRCLVPASGYFEWRKIPGSKAKQPFYITPADGSVLAFAGLWEYWKPEGGDGLVSMAIVTADAVGPLTEIHDRMPLILPASEWAAWLAPDTAAEAVRSMLAPPLPELVNALELRPVDRRVGNVRFDDPGLIERAAVD